MIGQYTEEGGTGHTVSYIFATTPMISRQSSPLPTRIRFPRAFTGLCQYSRAKFSETSATVTLLLVSAHAKLRPAIKGMPRVAKIPATRT